MSITKDIVQPILSQITGDRYTWVEFTNWGFDSGTGWSLATGWTIGSGVASCDGTQTANSTMQTTSATIIEANTTYEIEFDLTLTAGQFRLFLGGFVSTSWYTSGGHKAATIVVAGSNNGKVMCQGNADFTGTIDNITIRKMA